MNKDRIKKLLSKKIPAMELFDNQVICPSCEEVTLKSHITDGICPECYVVAEDVQRHIDMQAESNDLWSGDLNEVGR